MKAWILIASVLAAGAAMPASAQTETYETPKYTPAQPTVLDPNFGLPTFGLRGSELPQQRTRALEPAAPDTPDFFKFQTDFTLPKAANTTGFAFPKAAGMTTGDTAPAVTMETPQFTTTEGGTTGTDTMSDDDTK